MSASSEPQVYSVWVPLDCDAPACENALGGWAVQETVTTLSDRHKEALPRFQAHITALGGLLLPQPASSLSALERSCAEVARSMGPFTASLEAVETGKTYFQSVYGTFDTKARQLLTLLHQRLEEAMDAHNARRRPSPPGNTYLPHVSLAYGNISDERRAALAREAVDVLQQGLRKRKGAESTSTPALAVPLAAAEKTRIPVATPVALRVAEIALVYTDLSKPTSTWRIVRRFPLTER